MGRTNGCFKRRTESKKSMIILGAGLSGLIAGNMLRRFKPKIYEAQSSLPNNHAALLRFRTDAVSNACAVPFKKVKVQKAVYFKGKLHAHTDLEMMNLYSRKVTGEYLQRSIEDLRLVERYISPSDFIAQASQQLNIQYSKQFGLLDLADSKENPTISTLPMDFMMDVTGWENKPEFKFMPIWSVTADICQPCDLYQTIYYPSDHGAQFYRASITGKKLIVEYVDEPPGREDGGDDLIEITKHFGVWDAGYENVKTKHQKYGKLLPIDDRLRKEFMLWLTKEHNIYSLGRFATWRQILLDDVVKDVNVIEGLMQSSSYDNNKHWRAA